MISILEVEEATRLACKFTDYMYDYNLLWERTPEEQCFILLPWRHSGDVDNMITSVRIIKQYQKVYKYLFISVLFRLLFEKLQNTIHLNI